MLIIHDIIIPDKMQYIESCPRCGKHYLDGANLLDYKKDNEIDNNRVIEDDEIKIVDDFGSNSIYSTTSICGGLKYLFSKQFNCCRLSIKYNIYERINEV